jgi:putative DNA primase/helicase
MKNTKNTPGNLLELPVVEPWPEPVDGKALLDELARLLNRFVILPIWAADTIALWVLHTYAFKWRDVSTYLGIESPVKRCGKTTLLTVLSEVANRVVVSSNISAAAFFRVIEEKQPTLLIDEADTLLPGNDELRGILNAGYSRKTAYVVRVANQEKETKENGAESRASRLVSFSSWCPKAIAAIGHLPETLADRCIIVRMQRKSPRQNCERCRNLDATVLKRQCARFVLDHGAPIASANPEIPPALNDRQADIWEPLLALADQAGGDWPHRAREAAVGLAGRATEEDPASSLLSDIRVVFKTRKLDRIHSQVLMLELNKLTGRPWAERRSGAETNVRWLSNQLRPHGIRPKLLRIGKTVGKGYVRADFDRANSIGHAM